MATAPQDMVETMRSAAGPLEGRAPDDKWIGFLRANREAAHLLGQLGEEADREFVAAFPGETRSQSFTNDQWAMHGFGYVAEENKLMGLTES